MLFLLLMFICVGLSMLVILGGIFLLVYTKKENIGIVFKLSSYVTILIGSALLIGGLFIGMIDVILHDIHGEKIHKCCQKEQIKSKLKSKINKGIQLHHGGMIHQKYCLKHTCKDQCEEKPDDIIKKKE